MNVCFVPEADIRFTKMFLDLSLYVYKEQHRKLFLEKQKKDLLLFKKGNRHK